MARKDSEPHFVNNPPNKYLCHHSPHILRSPVQVECGHRFCRDCIEFGYDESWVCSLCKMVVYKKNMNPVTDIKHRILSLVVYCSHEKNGCMWTGPWRQQKDHLSTCAYREMVRCQVCQQEIPKYRQEQHMRELCYRTCPYCRKTIRTSLFKVHQFNDCPQRTVDGFAESSGKPRLGRACECRNPCCSLYDVVHGVYCIQGVISIPVCVDGKGTENLSPGEQAEEDKLEKETKEISDAFEEILTLTKELLFQHVHIAQTYMSQKCPGGGDFFKECVQWYSLSDLKELVHIAFDNSIATSVLDKIKQYERKVDEFIVTRIIPCDYQVICLKVDSQFSRIPAKVCNIDLLAKRVKQAVSEHTGKEYKVWFCSAHQALKLELQDAVQCSTNDTSDVDQNKILPISSFDLDAQTNEHETNQSHSLRPFIASFGN